MLVIQIMKFNLEGMGEKEYREVCENLADSFAIVPGLLVKYWLVDSDNNGFGAVYIWKNRVSYESFRESNLYISVTSNPNVTNVTSEVFDVCAKPTKITRGFKIVDLLAKAEAMRYLRSGKL